MIKRSSLGDQIYELLKESIIKGVLKPGDRIVELEVAKTHGVSQAPVREALLRLNEEGFVVSHRHKGTFVSSLSRKDIEELYSLREVLESFAISRAIERIVPKDLDTLSNIYDKMLQAGKNNNLDKIRNTDIEFHDQIYKMADHELMFQMWEMVRSKADRFWYLTSQFYFSNLTELAKIHEPILNAFLTQNVKEGIKAFQDHLNYVKKEIFESDILDMENESVNG
ncbi:GntR family transcriptional regulator [Aneurinibacillus terranovensis]|uniref:GntR family transcriptional regulator n=1 Tax=Aneurinibacillus terranovensis TaxID=278991 RepID=UPI0003F7CE5A|nr:GntR family transcriptional regulator [Aneurinibacillus terranovensis]